MPAKVTHVHVTFPGLLSYLLNFLCCEGTRVQYISYFRILLSSLIINYLPLQEMVQHALRVIFRADQQNFREMLNFFPETSKLTFCSVFYKVFLTAPFNVKTKKTLFCPVNPTF